MLVLRVVDGISKLNTGIYSTVTTAILNISDNTTVNGKYYRVIISNNYQITPAGNPLTVTANVTLYFTQAEFDAFNTAPGSLLDLPTGSVDIAGISNLRIGKYSGSSNDGSGLPGSYTSGVSVIDPSDANIIWNAVNNYWEVTFAVSGFSGFIVQTNASVLPLNLLSFSADVSGNDVRVNWKTSNELNHDHFELQRSTGNGIFTNVATIVALSGDNNNYDFTDRNAASLGASKLSYRLKMVGQSGTFEYSTIVFVSLNRTNELITNIELLIRRASQFLRGSFLKKYPPIPTFYCGAVVYSVTEVITSVITTKQIKES